MEIAVGVSFVLFISCMIYWFFDDDDPTFVFIVGVISFMVFVFSVNGLTKKEHETNSITIQEIEYAINKCSSFGGLKEFRSDVIICMDKTEININFEPEKKVEAE